MNKLKICITIDTEFSIAGTFRNPSKYQPVGKQSVYCNVGEKSEGLNFILKTMADTGIKGTFFIEASNYAYFGDKPMEEIVNDILNHEQDIQLHIHPVWNQVFSIPNWQDKINELQPNDSVLTRSLAQLEDIIGEGIITLERWSGYKAEALRTGNLHVNMDVYKAMNNAGLSISSNIGRGIYKPMNNDLNISHGCKKIEGIYEFPVTSYIGLKLFGIKELKSLTIIGSSFTETKWIIDQAYENNISSVVILTHPFEYIKGHDLQYNMAKINKISQNRLRKICSYISSNSNKFDPVPIIKLCKIEGSSNETILSTPNLASIRRIAVNKLFW